MFRILRILTMGIGLAGLVEIAQTTPYLGLPFEPKPQFMDCYEQATWDGRQFVETGRTICLGSLSASERP